MLMEKKENSPLIGTTQGGIISIHGEYVRVSKRLARKIFEISPKEIIIYPENSLPYGREEFSNMSSYPYNGSQTFDDLVKFYFDYWMRGFRYGGRYPAFAVSLSWWNQNCQRVIQSKN